MTAQDLARRFTRCIWLFVCLLLIPLAADSATGRTPGAFTVSPTGAAQYSIPIWTPPGAGGMRPQLSVFYSHNRDNGILGVGFDVGGFSTITRCVKTIAQDGARAGIKMTADDVFCLDGNRLRMKTGTNYGEAGSTYQTELETYARITANSTAGTGPAWFKVEQRNGLIYEYGSNASSRIDFGGGTVKEWALSAIRDRSGNTIEFKYDEDNTNGVYRPDEINYATNANTSLTTAPYQVKFVYETATRPDPMYGFWPAGGAQNEIKRLQSIDIKHGSPLATQKMYVFTYTTGAGSRSRLDEVKECSTGTGDCLTPSKFTWTTSTAGLQSEQDPSLTTPYQLHMMDMTGDGKDDVVYVNSATNGTWRVRKSNTSGGLDGQYDTTRANPNNTLAQPIRWDADDKMDLLYPSGGTWRVLRSDGTTFEAAYNTGISTNVEGEVQPLDINGDGLDDLVRATSSGGAALRVRYNTGGGFSGTETLLWQSPYSTLTFQSAFPLVYQRYRSAQRRADFDGDGKEDFVCWLTYVDDFETTWTYTARCSAAGYEAFQESDGSTFLGGSFMYGDLNDDGLSDLVWSGSSTFNIVYGGTTSIVTGPSNSGLNTFSMVVADYDGDGKDDLLAQSTTTPFPLKWLRSTGTGLASASTTGVNYSTSSAFYIGQINGDGFYDVVSAGTAVKYRLHETTYSDLMASAADGFNVKAIFSYVPMTDTTVYTKGTGASHPQQDMQSTRPLVKVVTLTDGTGTDSTYTLTYSYEKGRRDHWGRGFLGFEKRKVLDSRSGLRREETFLHTWPYTGLLKNASAIQNSTGYVLSLTDNDWTTLSYSGRQFPYAWKSETKDRELNNTHFRTITIQLPGSTGQGIDNSWGIVTGATITRTYLKIAKLS